MKHTLDDYLADKLTIAEFPGVLREAFQHDEGGIQMVDKSSLLRYRDDIAQSKLPAADLLFFAQRLLFWSTLAITLLTAGVIYYSHRVRMGLHT